MLTEGTRLGPYQVLGPLGAGGMGEVYRARDERLGRDVALKILPAQFAEDPDRLVRFQREAKAVAALVHPNIIVVHDFGTDQGLTFTVSELLEGETLRHRLIQSALPWRKSVELAVAIADGLAAAHAKGIVHRDLKPDNIFITTDDRVKILDFGLAKLLAESPAVEPIETEIYSPALTKTGTILGTAPYMSPEQLRGQPVDARSDIFSFGCTLYEMVAGKCPFTGKTDADVTAAILHNDPPELTDSGKKVPVELERLIRRCLEKNPEARFQSARDMAFALRGIATGSGEVQVPPPRTRRFYIGLAGGGVVVAALILAIVLWPRNPSANPPDTDRSLPPAAIEVAVLPFINNTKDVEADYLCDGLPGGIIKSLSDVGKLKVRSFSSVARYAGQEVNMEELGRKLKVQAVLTGRISRRQDGFTLAVELVNVADDSVLWRETYDTKTRDVQAMQLEIARHLCARLKVTISADENKKLGKRYTENSEAYRLCLLGRHHLLKETSDGMTKAEQCFRQAIVDDPACALAHAELAATYLFSGEWLKPPREVLSEARKAAQKAVELDGRLAEASSVLGSILFWHDWDWPAAEKELKRALELNPSLNGAQSSYCYLLVRQRRFDEAEKTIAKAVQRDPLTPWINIDVAFLHYYKRQFDRVIQDCDRVLELDSSYVTAHRMLGMAHLGKKHYPQALAALQRACQMDNSVFTKTWLGLAYGLSGDTAAAQKMLEEMKALSAEGRYVAPFLIAVIQMGMGEKDQACAWLEKAYEDRNSVMVLLDISPVFESLHAEPRFKALVKKMNFP